MQTFFAAVSTVKTSCIVGYATTVVMDPSAKIVLNAVPVDMGESIVTFAVYVFMVVGRKDVKRVAKRDFVNMVLRLFDAFAAPNPCVIFMSRKGS